MAKKKATKKKSKPACKCVEQVNKKLEEMGFVLESTHGINFKTSSVQSIGPSLVVERVGKHRKKAPTILCTYCPFCGKKK